LYWDLLADATFHELLLAYDRDLADTTRRAGCARCCGVAALFIPPIGASRVADPAGSDASTTCA